MSILLITFKYMYMGTKQSGRINVPVNTMERMRYFAFDGRR
jgi:hypothetical protein